MAVSVFKGPSRNNSKVCGLFIKLLWILPICHALNVGEYCPRLLHQVFEGYAPIGKFFFHLCGNLAIYLINFLITEQISELGVQILNCSRMFLWFSIV